MEMFIPYEICERVFTTKECLLINNHIHTFIIKNLEWYEENHDTFIIKVPNYPFQKIRFQIYIIKDREIKRDFRRKKPITKILTNVKIVYISKTSTIYLEHLIYFIDKFFEKDSKRSFRLYNYDPRAIDILKSRKKSFVEKKGILRITKQPTVYRR